MNKKGYNVIRKTTTRYEFVSIGPKGQIKKRIEFTPLKKRNYYNIGFGDVLQNGQVSDTVYSNNQDIVKVLSTVIEVIKDFLKQHPSAKVFLTGSTADRTNFYVRILKRYYEDFSKYFIITALVQDENKNYIEITFEPDKQHECLAFFVKNKT